ncbi:MAG: tetratricopeptide repeat protein [Promethearchaeota archaeon]
MSGTQEINYPPEELIEPSKLSRRNFEHIILWMLNNNKIVEWADFKEDPISISQSTLSNYLTMLESKGYIERIKRGNYRITVAGQDRFNEISRAKEAKRGLNFPPRAISGSRNYDHIILWMAYNNNYLKWSDFTEEDSPVKINQSSLSKNINLLLDNKFIRKDENKEYRITRAGKTEYSRVLKLYDLDRQSILNEESKRIKEITKKTIGFFERYRIKEDNIKFRFLNYVLTLSFEKLKGSLESEEDFNKILLFLSINHPDQYPVYISPEDFSKEYDIDMLDLRFNIRQIIDKNIYTLKFFKLETEGDKEYYFQANERIEKILRAITEDYITRFTYLNKLYEEIPSCALPLTLESVVERIVEKICDNVFHEGLKPSLKKFLPRYIKYLAYKIETEKKLEEITDKLEGSIWQEFFSSSIEHSTTYEEINENYFLYPKIFDILELYYLTSKISKIQKRTKSLLDSKENEKALDYVNSKIDAGLNDIEILLFKAIVLCHVNKEFEAINLIEEEINYEKYRDDERIYMTSSFILAFSYTAIGKIKEALKIIDNLYELYPDHQISLATKILVLAYSVIYEFDIGERNDEYVLDLIDEAINNDSNSLNKIRFYQLKSTVLEQMDKYEEALEAIDNAIKLMPDIIDLYYNKSKLLMKGENYEEAIAILEYSMKMFPEKKQYFLMQKAFVLKEAGNFEEGIQIVNNVIKEYPEETDRENELAYFYIYVYQENMKNGISDEKNKKKAIEIIKNLTEKVPDEGNYFDSYGEILFITGDYENSINNYKKAIEIDPNGWFAPASYLGIGKCYQKLGKFEEAMEYLQKAKKMLHVCYCHFKHKKEWDEEINFYINKIKDSN